MNTLYQLLLFRLTGAMILHIDDIGSQKKILFLVAQYLMKILDFKNDWGKYILKEIQNNKELLKLGFSATVVLVCIFEKSYKELKSP